MVNRHVLYLTLSFLLLIIIGCSGGKSGGPNDPNIQNLNYRTGSQGLTLEYAQGTLNKVFERDENINFVVNVRNRGAFPQPDDTFGLDAHLWVYGFDQNILAIEPDESLLSDEDLPGRNQFNTEGGRQPVVLSGTVFELPKGTPVFNPNIVTAVTYTYETVASGEVCIDPFPFSTRVGDKVCNVNQYTSVNVGGSQGAPVAISHVKQEAANEAILFTITVSEVGNGLIIPIEEVNRNPNLKYDYDSLDEIRVSDISVGNIPMTSCRPYAGDRIKLINGQGVMFCKFSTVGIENVYTSPINIRLEYGYMTSIEKEIQIIEEVGI